MYLTRDHGVSSQQTLDPGLLTQRLKFFIRASEIVGLSPGLFFSPSDPSTTWFSGQSEDAIKERPAPMPTLLWSLLEFSVESYSMSPGNHCQYTSWCSTFHKYLVPCLIIDPLLVGILSYVSSLVFHRCMSRRKKRRNEIISFWGIKWSWEVTEVIFVVVFGLYWFFIVANGLL